VPPTTFLEAAVIARLRTGDVPGARAAFTQLSAGGGRPEDDLRTLLLEAHLTAAEHALSGGPPAATPRE